MTQLAPMASAQALRQLGVRLVLSSFLVAVTQIGAVEDSSVCSRGLHATCSHAGDVFEAMSESELEAAEDNLADMMRVELIQKAQVQIRSPTAVPHNAKSTPVSHSEAISQTEMEAQEDSEAAMMGIELIQTARLQQRGQMSAGDTASERTGIEIGRSAVLNSQAADKLKGLPGAATVATASPQKENSNPSAGRESPVAAATARKPAVEEPSWRFLQLSIVLVFVAAMIAQGLACTGRFGSTPKSKSRMTLPPASSETAIRSHVQQLKLTTASDLEAVSSSGKGLPVGGPVRVVARIEGLMDRSTMQSPLTQQACVMYSAAAMVNGEVSPSAKCSKRADFIVSMVNAPWVKILVEGGDVLCFGMKGGLWLWQHTKKSKEEIPDHVKEFVISQTGENQMVDPELEHPPCGGDVAVDWDVVELEESALVVGSVVTLVGKLCRGPGGQLSLQRSQADACGLPGTSPKESCLTPGKGQYGAEDSSESWTGKILVCDDPVFMSQ